MQAIQYVHPQQIPHPQTYMQHHLQPQVQQQQQQQYIHQQQANAYPIHQHYTHAPSAQPQIPITHAQPVAQFQFLYSPQSTVATKPTQQQQQQQQPGGVIYATPTAAQQQYYHQQQPQPQAYGITVSHF